MSSKLIFFKLEFPKPDPKIPTPLQVRICARHDAGFYPLTPRITESELDNYINDLIRELEQIRRQGKRKFETWPWRRKSN